LLATSLMGQEPPFLAVPPAQSGIRWTHENARSDARHLPESLGPGVAIFDYDSDGDQDVYFVNSGPSDFYAPAAELTSALYRNDGDGAFTDVTREARVEGNVFGMGAAAADYDADGHPDLLVTAYGPLRLYRNNGDGTFTDVAQPAGVAYDGWTTSAVWFDYDADGDLDLFVCSFVKYAANSVDCGLNKLGKRFYCIPKLFEPTPSLLFENLGQGKFRRADPRTAIAKAQGKALGVVAVDVNQDRRLDLFVANDTVQNFLFLNRGPGKWDEVGLFAEVAYSADGRPRSGMGVDAADIDGDGRIELFVANVDGELFSLYRNNGDETFSDIARQNGVADATRFLSGWGLRFFDYDNDGDEDLLLANGHPDDMVELQRARVRYREPLLLFRNDDGVLRDVSASSGPLFSRAYPARGLATGDLDNDGRLDFIVGNNGEAPVVALNRTATNNWIGLELQGLAANREGAGALIRWSAGGVVRTRQKTSGGSYLSSHDPREILGLADSPLDWIEIEWPAPSERIERFNGLDSRRYHILREGAGQSP
jgi:hypothetical protein